MSKWCLTSTDFFLLALDKYNVNKDEGGNTCRYMLEVNGRIDDDIFSSTIASNKIVKELSLLHVCRRFLKMPIWESKKQTNKETIPLNFFSSDDRFPDEVFHVKRTQKSKISFDLVHRSNGNSLIVFSWHHLLMDGFGAVILLKHLFGNAPAPAMRVVIGGDKKILGRAVKLFFKNMAHSISGIFRKPLKGTHNLIKSKKGNERLILSNFTSEESSKIDENALKMGARYGRSPYFLAIASRAIVKFFSKKELPATKLWVPMPQDIRKKGARGPLVGNHLSFLFFDIFPETATNLKALVNDIQNQMVDQVRRKVPNVYNALMKGLRRIPLFLFYQFVKGPKGGSLASFLFTVAADHPQELEQVFDLEVTKALSIPPNTYPPGVTFAFMRFKDELQVMLLYYSNICTEEEAHQILEMVTYELKEGKHYGDN